MSYKIIILVTFLMGLTNFASSQQDAMMRPIDEKSLIQTIQKLPLSSPQQSEMMNRAAASGLSRVAYDQYTLLWQRSPQDAYANLRRGEAAEDYWQYATQPDIHEFSLTSPQAQKIFQVARDCLVAALEKAPNDASTNFAYGHFLFWHGSQMSKGLSYMKIAVAISPKSYAAHATLGDAYAEHSGEAYNLPRAENELKRAAMLNPTASFPHWRLIRVYIDENRRQNAKRELQVYVSLTPPSATQTKVIDYYRGEFNHSQQQNP
jgi:hypothetical protein